MIDRCVALVKNKNKFCKIGTDNGTQMQVDSHPNMSSEALKGWEIPALEGSKLLNSWASKYYYYVLSSMCVIIALFLKQNK